MDEASRKFLEGSLQQLLEKFPEFKVVIERVQKGELTQDEAFVEMSRRMGIYRCYRNMY